MTLRRRLLLQMLAVLLPTAGLFAWIVVAAYERELDTERQHLRETVRALALVVDREFDQRAAIARTLAVTSGLAEGDHRRFYDEARAATQGTDDWVVLTDGENELVDTEVPFGTPLPRPSWRLPTPPADSPPQVVDLRIGPITKQPMLQVVTPVPKVVPAHVSVAVAFTPDALQGILTQQRLPAGWVAVILDRERRVVARAPNPELWVGKPAAPDLVNALRASPEGFLESVTFDGTAVRAYYSLTPTYGWGVTIGVPQNAVTAAARQAAWTAGVGAALLALFALALAAWSAQRLRGPIESLERAAHELAQDRVPTIAPTGLDEADAVGAALYRAGVQSAQINEELERRVAAALDAARRAQARNEELQRVLAEELLHLITDNLPVLIAYADREGRYRLNNKAYETWFGRPRSEITGKLVREVVGERRWPEIAPRLDAALAGEPQQFEISFEYPGVGLRHVEMTYVPHRGPGASVKGVAILVQDMSARHRSHEELRRTEEAQRLLVALHDASRGVRDPAQLQAEITRRVARHFGASRCSYAEVDAPGQWAVIERDHAELQPSLAGRHRLDDYGPALAADLRAGRTVAVADVLEDERCSLPAQHAAFAALQVRSLLVVPLVKEDRLVAAFALLHHEPRRWSAAEIGLFEQVAERTWFVVENARTENQLRESRNVLSLAMRGGRMGAWSRDVAHDRVWWSRELEEIFGLAPGGFPGTTEGFRELIHPDDRDVVEQAVAQAVEAGADYSVEFRFRHAGGEWRWMDGRGRAVYGPQGQPAMLYGIGIDITARKRSEDELRRLNRELAEAHRRKDEFLATLAHELRNPLAPMTNALEILRRKEPQDPMLRWTRDVLDRQVRQMARLVDDLLDVARITRGRIELRREPVALAAVVHAAVESARPVVDAGGHALEVQVPEQPVWLQADATRITQVLLNLLNNAAKYTPPGGRIVLSARAHGGEAAISVRDNGIGLAPEHLPLVFQMFSQVAPALERSQGGLGIGLALARGLVELHGGRIEARSAGLGQGSEFIVHLPLAPAPADDAATPASGDEHPLPPLRVLVVDDNRDAAESLAALLRMGGHQVAVAHSGEAALTVCETFHPALALLDIGMPGMNGYELARRLRELPGARVPPVLAALTGWGQQDDKRRAFEAGFDHHLTKPVELDALDAVLAAAAAATAAG